MGGTVAWLAAQPRPARLARLVIEDSPPPPAGRTAVPAPPRPDGPLPFDYEAIVAIVGQVNNPDPAWWDELPKVAVPTLVIAGGPDSHVPQDLLGEAAARVPHGRLVRIPAGHHVHRTRPADFVAAVREFLAGT
jgi:pimeloyl-ACP methyl ester carboxylesterase